VTDLQAACLESIKLCHLLKERFPFLRIDTLQRAADVICALIEKQTTNQKNLANGLPGTSSPEAKRKRLARCFQDEQFDACVLPFLISLLPKGKLVLSMDRTNWEYGETPLNLLVLGVVLEGFTLPLVWVALPHGGCSDSYQLRLKRASFRSLLQRIEVMLQHRARDLWGTYRQGNDAVVGRRPQCKD
jgi:hypothetical protein